MLLMIFLESFYHVHAVATVFCSMHSIVFPKPTPKSYSAMAAGDTPVGLAKLRVPIDEECGE
jgi:hypothetical protein